MGFITTCGARLRFFLRNTVRYSQVERDLDRELAVHRELLIEQKIAEGMSPREARRAVHLELGDVARLKGLYRTVGGLLGDKFNAKRFTQHYEHLNRARYHHLTGDNQDYLAYICLVLNNDGLDCTDLLERIESGAVQTFEQFVRYAEVCIAGGGRVSEAMRQAHEAVNTAVSQGDPTPFKQFGREEYLATLEHMNNLADDVPAEERFHQEICITQEVREAVLGLKERGCLIISFSDKPDESSIPHHSRHRGKQPIHKAITHATGVSIADRLRSL